MATKTANLENFFTSLKRPPSPNNWLVAPVDFAIKPDAIAPVFDVPLFALRDSFGSVVLGSTRIAVIEESANAIHAVVTTPLMQFKDDVWAQFIPIAKSRATLALYSASRAGYWDFGTNRRRLGDWVERLQGALTARPV